MSMTMGRLREWFDALPDEIRDDFADFQPRDEGVSFDDQSQMVAEVMRGDWEAPTAPGCDDLVFDGVYDGVGSRVGWTVGLSHGALCITSYVEWDDLTWDQSATGIDQAWATAQGIAALVARAQEYIDRSRDGSNGDV